MTRPEQRLLHLGSLLPHKRTRRTIQLFQAFNHAEGGGWRLGVVGLTRLPTEWDIDASDGLELLGPLTAERLRQEILRARALLFLSEIEGFGLPALEAWFLGTPVCYAADAVGEVLAGVPGRCAGMDDRSFREALQAVLTLTEEDRARNRQALRGSYGPDAFGERMAALVRQWLGESRRAQSLARFVGGSHV